jgi:hypothetical protein
MCFAIAAKAQQLVVTFNKVEIAIVQGELVTNVVKIANTGTSTKEIKLSIDYPAEWKQIGNQLQIYNIAPGDSVFVPVRLIPSQTIGGNNRFMINANVTGVDDKYLGEATFWAFTQKKTSWVINSLDGNKIYFKNGENNVKFDVNVLNTGAEKQRITMTLNNLSLFSTVVDSLGVNKTLKPIQLNLESKEDTTLSFVYRHESGDRNNTRIDIENHKPYSQKEAKTFSLFVNTEEPNLGEEGAYRANQRIIFKKLSDEVVSNPSAFTRLPLVVDYNVSNLMDNISFSTLNVRGNAQVSNNAQIMYNLQASATSDRYSDALKNSNYYFGYFHNKGSVQLGFVNGGLMGLQSFGKGAKVGVQLNKRVLVNAFYTASSDRFGDYFLHSKGASAHVQYFKQNKLIVEYGESDNKASGVLTRVLNTRTGISFFRTQTFTIALSNSWNEIGLNNKKTFGQFYLINYAGNFFKNKLDINHAIGNSNADYSNTGISRLFYNHRTRYNYAENWSITMVNSYSNTQSKIFFNGNVTSLINQLSVNRAYKFQSVQLAAFYNTFNFTQSNNLVRGVSLNHNTFKPKEHTRFSATIEVGVNTPKDTSKQIKNLPFLMFNGLLFYKTLTVNARYIMGAYGTAPAINTGFGGITQQMFSSAIQHQYLLKNTKFMLQTGLNYYYNNLFKQHSLNLFPEIYYYTQSGWRFRGGLNYNLISGQALKNVYNNALVSDEVPRITTQGIFVSMGVRKEFSLPVPTRTHRHIDAEFLAFFDVNGNGIKDRNERVYENVVIKLGEDEVITNEEGAAKILNANAGLNKLAVMPLDEVTAWFANVNDSILVLNGKTIQIPFVKGVKIKGKVCIKREKIAVDALEPFDLSRIKITANGQKSFSTLTSTDGSFEFYLPFGLYTLNFDEQVLGTKFRLTRNNMQLEVTKDTDGVVVSFMVVEKTRRINKKVFSAPDSAVPKNDK